MRKIFKSTLALAASALALAGVVVTPSLSSAWGDNSGGRRSYTIDQINHGALGNKIVFNSISDSVIGDEKNFVGAREYNGPNLYNKPTSWNGNDITVKDGQEYIIRLYAHNNNPNGLAGVSHNTRVAFDIPEYSAKQIQVNGFIFSDNASPSQYWDYVNFNSDQAFHLEYVYGSALLENNGIGAYEYDETGKVVSGGQKLGDEIVTKAASEHGVQIGYDKLDGEVPGCYNYANYITIRVKAVFDQEYTVNQRVRKVGDTKWEKNITVNVGDIVEFRTIYKNTNAISQTQSNVMAKTILPKNLRYVPNTTVLTNGHFPNGATYTTDTLLTTGVNIGHYNQNANAYIDFKAQVVDENLQCGSNTMVDWTQIGVGQKTLQDYASVTVINGTCTDEEVKEHSVRVDYIYAETGEKVADSYIGSFRPGDPFFVDSPVISGYTASTERVSGKMGNNDLTYVVEYTKTPVDEPKPVDPIEPDPVIPDEPEPTPVDPEDPTPEQPSDLGPVTPEPLLPQTGPAEIAGSVLALGSVATSAGYYVASRRALRK